MRPEFPGGVMAYELIQGDCLDVMRSMPDNSVDSVVTDPPYGLAFMNKEWDKPGVAYQVDLWHEALRVLKPGGHLLAFGGTRTYHRMAVAIEDAGFEIRDSLMWIYGSGFPKSHNLKDDWQGWGTALKPAHEPIVMARKPFKGTVAANVLAHRTGSLNVDGCRVGTFQNTTPSGMDRYNAALQEQGYRPGAYHKGVPEPSGATGRWPPNTLLDTSAAAALDAQSGVTKSRKGEPRKSKFPGHGYGMTHTGSEYDDSGGSSRFFPVFEPEYDAPFRYQAKASRAERNAGLEGMPEKLGGSLEGGNDKRKGDKPQLTMRANFHPTVKPIKLMEWLVRLVTPPGGTCLDPFCGSGSTGVASINEGFSFIGIEREAEYIEIARRRIEHAARQVRQLEMSAD